jgi:diaminopimelate decarboxylase
MGAIPAGYAADADGMLLIGGRRADALVAETGGHAPVRLRPVADRPPDRSFRASFPGIELHYAIKGKLI